jgi:hypothetical protein
MGKGNPEEKRHRKMTRPGGGIKPAIGFPRAASLKDV